jgi:hypothetical protein
MEKVVHLFEIFKPIFYFKIFKLRKILFGSVKVWKDFELKYTIWIFEFDSKSVWTAPPHAVAGAHQSATPTPLSGCPSPPLLPPCGVAQGPVSPENPHSAAPFKRGQSSPAPLFPRACFLPPQCAWPATPTPVQLSKLAGRSNVSDAGTEAATAPSTPQRWAPPPKLFRLGTLALTSSSPF